MRYSRELLLKSIGYVVPNLRIIMSAQSSSAITTFIDIACIEYFLREHNLSQDMSHGKIVLKCAKRELKEFGFITFGDVNEHWM